MAPPRHATPRTPRRGVTARRPSHSSVRALNGTEWNPGGTGAEGEGWGLAAQAAPPAGAVAVPALCVKLLYLLYLRVAVFVAEPILPRRRKHPLQAYRCNEVFASVSESTRGGRVS